MKSLKFLFSCSNLGHELLKIMGNSKQFHELSKITCYHLK